MPKLIIFDLDGTINVHPEFYRKAYSGTLERLIEMKSGKNGLKMLQHCRETCGGKGELALLALNIPYHEWAKMLIEVTMDLIVPQPTLCERLKKLKTRKVIYTGSPVQMAHRLLERLGFSPCSDFDLVLGWRRPEIFPVKWTCSPVVFDSIMKMFSVDAQEVCAVGDVWETDLLPAHTIGIQTVLVGTVEQGSPKLKFETLDSYLATIS